ncbi:SlyX family protein [Geobacter grbiciae]|uniref:SlyX family protein n=1 Tax=Geobacter grbiciae TaxID=155042 RepID=UPI001C00B033|nr:SlyX family protein [Geobacter grbiciae]MBT1073848.1 SlyX family protein [Geobacter grbiciae]
MNDRITDLEIHVTHLSRTVQELNDVVYRQQQTIDRLEAELKGLREQALAVAPSLVRKPEDEEPPPHY